MQIATEAGHWYAPDGSPAYQILGKNGMLRNTTLRDARKLNLAPSVSTITRCCAAPQLENWRIKQHLKMAISSPMRSEEETDEYIDRIIATTKEELAKAPDLGTKIHGDIEKAMFDTVWIPSPEASAAIKALGQWCGHDGFHSEKSFRHPLGYGGKVDVHKNGFVVDFKTKEFGPDDLPQTWDNHAMQLTAYRHGLGMPTARCAIIYVSTSIPGLTHTVEVSPEELDRGWEMFKALLTYWKHKNRCLIGD